ncbi:hypothetical protein Q5H93_06205 [Hymenobacter sp. ASUV-10]|uniref:Uncharacterized protein n=1 Tax=Hymenobacter aranciens TaxID=3063996 RepID=A0ABT9BCP7_9BACT|nr:hypothetical protein [Hymenobacter sp. ASUV-10]MDO7874318.1 hypothetical protein [Hymenobacter sp. ASUV-10]
MKTFKLDGKEYRYPEHWSEVTYWQFVAYSAIKADTDLSPLRKAGDAVALLTGLEQAIINAAEPRLVVSVLEQMAFLNEEPSEPVVAKFDASGETYYVQEMDRKTFGQFAAYEDIAHRHRKEPLQALPQQLVMLCRKAGETADDLTADETARRTELFFELPVTTVLGVAAFFTAAARSIHSATVSSSAVLAVRAALLQRLDAIIKNAGDGSVPQLPWQRRLYARLIRWCLR